jgi:hypothetical protein
MPPCGLKVFSVLLEDGEYFYGGYESLEIYVRSINISKNSKFPLILDAISIYKQAANGF